MTEDALLEPKLADFLDGRDHLTLDDVDVLWALLVPTSTPATEDAREEFKDALIELDPTDELEFKLGVWKLDLRAKSPQMIGALLLYSLIQAQTGIDLVRSAAGAVLVALTGFDRVKLEAREKQILMTLRPRISLDDPAEIRDLYKALPRDTRRTLSETDFRAFLDKLKELGQAKTDKTGRIAIVPEGKEPWLKVTLAKN